MLSLHKSIAAVLLVLFGLLTINNTIYQHRHILPDGTVIIHAHPFKTNPDGSPVKHTHTANEYIILSAVFHSVYLKAESVSLIALPVTGVISIIAPYIFRITVPFAIAVLSLRGPPIC